MSARRTGATVLVVDDDSEVRAFERRVLEGIGYGVLEATNGASYARALRHGAHRWVDGRSP